MSNASTLQDVIDRVVAPDSEKIDEQARFPREAIAALGAAGILGLTVSKELGGGGGGLREAADTITQLAAVCCSTAMVTVMHFAATSAIEQHGPAEVRRAIAAGEHLSTLAFSERGSRSQFWAPVSTAVPQGDLVAIEAEKSWVTSAGEADSYVWSSRPVAGEGPMTLWLVPSDASGLEVLAPFDGLGLRGNCSRPMSASMTISHDAMLGADGSGLAIAMSDVLPWFLVLSAALSVGLMQRVIDETGRHLRATRFEHLDQSLIEQPIARADHARMRLTCDQAAALLEMTLQAIEAGRDEAMLKVLEVKAVASDAALAVTDLAMKVCGGAAFRKELAIERFFRDARAARVMAPTTDALLDFVGRAINEMPLL